MLFVSVLALATTHSLCISKIWLLAIYSFASMFGQRNLVAEKEAMKAAKVKNEPPWKADQQKK